MILTNNTLNTLYKLLPHFEGELETIYDIYDSIHDKVARFETDGAEQRIQKMEAEEMLREGTYSKDKTKREEALKNLETLNKELSQLADKEVEVDLSAKETEETTKSNIQRFTYKELVENGIITGKHTLGVYIELKKAFQ